mgnify:CR=1 FL=1|jgi:hypothetical protein
MNLRMSFMSATAMAIGFAAVAPAIAQNDSTQTTTTTTVTKHHYVYYGAHDIYFAPERKTYYWREGNSWKSGAELPTADRGYITTGGVKIDLDTETPYERNDWVVKHYRNGHEVDSDGHGDRDPNDHDHR